MRKKKFGRPKFFQSDGQFGQFGRPSQFFSAFSGIVVSTFKKLKILRSVMIFRESVKLKKNLVGG